MTTPTRKIFNRFPRTLDDLHIIWEKYNGKSQPEPFGQYMMKRFAKKDASWTELEHMMDNWMAYAMVANLYK
jgi:hypothetical protein